MFIATLAGIGTQEMSCDVENDGAGTRSGLGAARSSRRPAMRPAIRELLIECCIRRSDRTQAGLCALVWLTAGSASERGERHGVPVFHYRTFDPLDR
jgi:hypothetical protein